MSSVLSKCVCVCMCECRERGGGKARKIKVIRCIVKKNTGKRRAGEFTIPITPKGIGYLLMFEKNLERYIVKSLDLFTLH